MGRSSQHEETEELEVGTQVQSCALEPCRNIRRYSLEGGIALTVAEWKMAGLKIIMQGSKKVKAEYPCSFHTWYLAI